MRQMSIYLFSKTVEENCFLETDSVEVKKKKETIFFCVVENSDKIKKKKTLMSDKCCHITRWLKTVSHL